jgi:molybdenum-dependent DNA-binding transcriptional regulator ModE
MEIEPVVSLRVNGVALTPHQLEVLLAVHRSGSQRKAGEKLGLATPVVHRYLNQIERKAKTRLMTASPMGTVLTEEGEKVAMEYLALLERMKQGDSVVVGCTIVTEELLLSVLSRLDAEAKYDLIISDDERNLKDFKAGMMDVMVLDDPLFAYELEDANFEEVGEDRLIHVEKGSGYMRFRYGAQRIGFRHLEASGKAFKVEGTTRSLASMVRSNLSFFVNESLALRKGFRLASSTDPGLLTHKIMAMFHEPRSEIEWLLRELRKERLSR